MAKENKEQKVEKIKPKKEMKKIQELTGSIGWVSFTPYQMGQIGIDPAKHTTTDLVNKVKDMLKIQRREEKEVEVKVEKKKE